MKLGIVLAFCLAIAFGSAPAQSPQSEEWVGVWHASVAGRPTDTLTLATDTGELGGTVVLDMIGNEDGTPRVIASDPHVLLSPRVNGSTLSFQVKMQKPDGTIVLPSFSVTLTSPRKANIHCTSCVGAPVVELTKDR